MQDPTSSRFRILWGVAFLGFPTAGVLARLAFYYLNAFLFAAFLFAVAHRTPRLFEQPVLSGAIYGIGIYVVMNYVVGPLSLIGPRPAPAAMVWTTGLLVHMFLIGVPIAIAAKKARART